jgi:serine O-acetyltransferase
VIADLRRDARRYVQLGGWWRCAGFWVVATWRLGAWARGLPTPLLRLPFKLLAAVVRWPWRAFLHVTLDARAIGPGFCLVHPSSIFVGPGVEIGEDCLVFHEVTIGTNAGDARNPVLGRQVDVYAGARILGGVRVGDRVMVGANCVVTRNVPPDTVLVVAPARLLPRSLARSTASRPPGPGDGPSAGRAGP